MIELAPCANTHITFDEAILYCQFLDYNNHTDWRMPTFEEYCSRDDIVGWCVIGDSKWQEGKWRITPVRDV